MKARLRVGLALALGVGALGQAACADQMDAAVRTPPATSNPQPVSPEDFGSAWPLAVASGSISCDPSGPAQVITFEASDGQRYGLNGYAESRGFPPIEDIATSTDTVWRLKMLGVQVCVHTHP